jgi:hypothetical protein
MVIRNGLGEGFGPKTLDLFKERDTSYLKRCAIEGELV